MRRREFVAALGTVAAWPLAARAQQRVWRIGLLDIIPQALNATNFDALRRGLRDLGYVEGQNLFIEYRSADGRAERFTELAGELVSLQVDLIVTRGTPAVLAVKNLSGTIPVVMAAIGDPLGSGAVGGLAQPGGNVTGLSAFVHELVAKRVELLREAVPRIARIGLLHNMSNPVASPQWDAVSIAARSYGIEAKLLDARSFSDLMHAFDAASVQRLDALLVANDTVMLLNHRNVVELAAKHRLPAIFASREFVDVGGLLAYAVSYPDLYRRAAIYVDKIFKGAKPANLPVEQPTKLELVINLKTAKALGLEIPPTLLARADEVIE